MQKNSGNALIFILIAIFLLGGLTALLSRSGTSTEETGDTEQSIIAANELLGYLTSLKVGVESLLQRGCSESDISLWYDSNGDGIEDASDRNYNTNSPIDRSCHVFRTEGAGISSKSIVKYLTNNPTGTGWNSNLVFTAQTMVQNLGTNQTELLVVINRVKKPICEQINKIAGIAMNGSNFYQDDFFSSTLFVGDYTLGSGDSNIGNNGAVYRNKKFGCTQNSAATPHLFYVLIAR